MHRWRTIKRWKLGSSYYVIQHCRRCEDWIRRTIALNEDKLDMVIEKYNERQPPEQQNP